jgi:uncharacterized protein (TIGR03067 family)
VKSIVATLRLTALLCLTFAFAHAGSADPEPPLTNAEALKKMQGRWEIVSLEFDGTPAGASDDASMVVIEKDRLVIKGASRHEPYTFKLDAGARPPRIDLTFDRPQSRPSPGIFKFEAGKLIIVNGGVGEARPSKFDGKTGTKFVLRRPKAGK